MLTQEFSIGFSEALGRKYFVQEAHVHGFVLAVLAEGQKELRMLIAQISFRKYSLGRLEV